MEKVILRLYEYLQVHKSMRWTLLSVLTAAMVLSALQLTYKEDISDFLPLGTEERTALDIYQDISGADRLMIVFNDPRYATDKSEVICKAIDYFCKDVAKRDTAGWTQGMTAEIDMEKLSEVQDFVYENIPHFLTHADYERMDSLLRQPDYISRQLDSDKEMLLFPSGGLLSQNISRDPLNLFTPVVTLLQKNQSEMQFENCDGYIFTADMTRAMVFMSSPFGNAETKKNAQLTEMLQQSIEATAHAFPQVKAHLVGGPEIAVGNARQIKLDSIIAVAIAVVLIMCLLFYSFRSVRNILLISVSVAWGWLFALAVMSLLHDSVSLIVIGIASVIVGIAVNYPLHLVAHTLHQPNPHLAVREIAKPLIVGNVTTVGAFLALVPLESTALRDLGLFASLLLVGTILFVLIFLPHMIAKGEVRNAESEEADSRPVTAASGGNTAFCFRNSFKIPVLVVLTLFFGYFAWQTEFDANMANINYMTDEQRADMEYFQQQTSSLRSSDESMLYVVSTASDIESALESSEAKGLDMTSHFLCSGKEQVKRLNEWQRFLERHSETLDKKLRAVAREKGFSNDAFSEFYEIINARYSPKPFVYFAPLTESVFAANVSIDKERGRYSIIDRLSVEKSSLPALKKRYPGSFDVAGMNAAMANALTDNFNYIGIACSVIVFLFLWFSFRSLTTAIVAFVPMAVSWVWILGIMALFGIKFNIVNIILATFIFGQGDDYTIFITEGCIYEHRTGKPILASYRRSIIISALIMFIGIGSLIIARHPALFSLAEITIIGMAAVVIMAWVLPPLILRMIWSRKS